MSLGGKGSSNGTQASQHPPRPLEPSMGLPYRGRVEDGSADGVSPQGAGALCDLEQLPNLSVPSGKMG